MNCHRYEEEIFQMPDLIYRKESNPNQTEKISDRILTLKQ